MILLIDNYDSFSYNLYQLMGAINPHIQVVRNDALTLGDIRALAPEAIVLSPGPGRPEDAGVCVEVVQELGVEIPILGVCLGHQAICQALGGTIGYAGTLVHGKAHPIRMADHPIFTGCGQETTVGRYHSLVLEEDTLPQSLRVIAHSRDGEVMAVAHRQYPMVGLQFHPESILTPLGPKMVANFLNHLTASVE
ncbi:MAG: aminodeoxychorismate/anthranilate synthase component II [Eubacteriaceae bacterium]|nr:aminodeoxychorismate/anthranilate synthase component II [Eubacteriaceae bacterium]